MRTISSEAFRIAEEIHKGALVTDNEVRSECRYAAEEMHGVTADQLYRAAECAYRQHFNS